LQREANKQVMLGSRPSQSEESRILDPAELNWEIYQPSLMGSDQVSMLTEAHETEPMEILADRDQDFADLLQERFQRNAGAGKAIHDQSQTRRTRQ
jgi:hypothetical protein